jgi:hypothetical protein
MVRRLHLVTAPTGACRLADPVNQRKRIPSTRRAGAKRQADNREHRQAVCHYPRWQAVSLRPTTSWFRRCNADFGKPPESANELSIAPRLGRAAGTPEVVEERTVGPTWRGFDPGSLLAMGIGSGGDRGA